MFTTITRVIIDVYENVVCDISDISIHHFVLMLMRCTRYRRHINGEVYVDGLGQERRNSSALTM